MQPFQGVRVIDITHVLAGPFAVYQLAVLGADVIRIDHPVEPDYARRGGFDPALSAAGMAPGFMTQASNKRSLSLDLKTEAGREVLRKLVAGADVLAENFRPGALEALGLGYEDLRRINPRLIYASFSAFGHTGEKRHYTGYDFNVQAASGIMEMTGTAEVHPLKCGPYVIDYATGTMGAFALAAALMQRVHTGTGQRIDLSMMDVAAILMSNFAVDYLHRGAHPGPSGDRGLAATSGQTYPTKDGLIMIGAANPREQARLWTLLGRPDLIKGPDAEARAVLGTILLTRTADEWEDHFQRNHVPANRVREMREMLEDPQTRDRGIFHRHEHVPAVGGPFTVPVAAFRFAHDGPRVDRLPPTLGQHNDEILEELGYGPAEVAALRTSGAVGDHRPVRSSVSDG